jgi:hypothetical protein
MVRILGPPQSKEGHSGVISPSGTGAGHLSPFLSTDWGCSGDPDSGVCVHGLDHCRC